MSLPCTEPCNTPPSGRWSRRDWYWALFLLVAIQVAYSPVWRAGFIWDDDAHVTENACVIGRSGYGEIWTSSSAVYYPLVLTTFRAEYSLWGANPLPFHIVNILMHSACVLLLWRVLGRLGVRGAAVGAALWGLHPVMVESVAWITELKNTQSCLFYLLSVYCFLTGYRREAGTGALWRLGLSQFFFVLAVTSKSSTVMLPAVLLLCAWWLDGKWQWRAARIVAPCFLISAAAAGWTIWEQKFHSLALGAEWKNTVAERIIIAGCDIWFYLGKLVWPHPLVFLYPRWEIDSGLPIAYLPALAACLVLSILWWYRNGPARVYFFAAAYFVLSLFPVLDFFSVYFFRYSFVGDHFQYLAGMGPLALAGAGIAEMFRRFKLNNTVWEPALGALFLLPLGLLTWRQSAIYTSEETLYSDVLARNPKCWLAYNNLGTLLLQKGQLPEALQHFQAALEQKPDYVEAHYNMGDALMRMGRVNDSIAQYNAALASDPTCYVAHNNLGVLLFQYGHFDEAIAHYRAALQARPDYPDANNNLGNALFRTGHLDDAIACYRAALDARPTYAEALNNLGTALSQTGQVPEAVASFRAALGVRPDYVEAHYGLGNTLLQQGDLAAAALQFRAALALNPRHADAANNLAWILSTSPDPSIRNGAEAVELAQRANVLQGGTNPIVLGTLAAAFAECGRFPEAINTVKEGIAIASHAGNPNVAATLEKHLEIYLRNQPLREPR